MNTDETVLLHQFSPGWGLPSTSPFCIKLETWLRLAGVPHRVVVQDDTRAGPKKKNPYIVLGDVKMGDSGLVIEFLKERFGVDPDRELGPIERANARTVTTMIEEHYYWALVHGLWVDDAGWAVFRAVFDGLPALVRPLVASMVRRDVRAHGWGQGMFRHTAAEIADMGRRDLDALAQVLGDRPWFGGSAPGTLDAVAYGFLAMTYGVPVDGPLRTHARTLPGLVSFTGRMRERCFPGAKAPAVGEGAA